MRKIKSVRQLNEHKQHLNDRIEELDNTMHRQWKELKTMIVPSNIIGGSLEAVMHKKPEPGLENGSLLKNLFSYGAGILTGKLVDKVIKKFSSNQ